MRSEKKCTIAHTSGALYRRPTTPITVSQLAVGQSKAVCEATVTS